jgi:hypothetical protein
MISAKLVVNLWIAKVGVGVAENRARWRDGEAYVQQWTVVG